MSDHLRERVLLAMQGALVGEIKPEMQAVAVSISQAQIQIRLFVDEGSGTDIAEDFDAGAVTQVVAHFCWPERGDPQVVFDWVAVPKGQVVILSAGYIAVFARADVSLRRGNERNTSA